MCQKQKIVAISALNYFLLVARGSTIKQKSAEIEIEREGRGRGEGEGENLEEEEQQTDDLLKLYYHGVMYGN